MNELTTERLNEIIADTGRPRVHAVDCTERYRMALELKAKREECEALQRERDREAREAAGYQKIAREAANAEEPGLLVLLVQHDGGEVRIFGPDRAAEERFAEVVARWWKLLQVTSDHLVLEERTKERDAAVAKLAELLAAAKGVAIIDCDPFAQGGMAAELRLRKAIAAAEQGGA